MILTLTKDEMLLTWRTIAGLEHIHSDCSIERFDGIDLDTLIEGRMRRWYLAMLDEGRPELLGQPTDTTTLLSVSNGVVKAEPTVRHLSAIRLSSWQREADVEPIEAVANRLILEQNPYSAAGNASPMAWRDQSGVVHVAPCENTDTVVSARAYTDPGPETYIMDERALKTIPTEL